MKGNILPQIATNLTDLTTKRDHDAKGEVRGEAVRSSKSRGTLNRDCLEMPMTEGCAY